MSYECKECGMGVKMTCSKCGEELKDGMVNKDGKDIQVAECPKQCGKVKAPSCCGHTMSA